jgi:hypothetical protein
MGGPVTEPLSVADMADVTLKLAELALTAADSNGGAAASPRVRYVLARLALAAPGTAARLPHVRNALDPAVLATVLASTRPATPPAPPRPDPADSQRLGTAAAAARLGISGAAVRAAAKRGSMRGQRDRVTGRWSFAAADVTEYGRANGQA